MQGPCLSRLIKLHINRLTYYQQMLLDPFSLLQKTALADPNLK